MNLPPPMAPLLGLSLPISVSLVTPHMGLRDILPALALVGTCLVYSYRAGREQSMCIFCLTQAWALWAFSNQVIYILILCPTMFPTWVLALIVLCM